METDNEETKEREDGDDVSGNDGRTLCFPAISGDT